MSKALETILIVKIGAIGDVIMALSVLKALRSRNNNIKISWICGSVVSALIHNTNEVDEVIIVDEEKLLKGPLFRKIKELLSIWKRIIFRRYDLVFIGNYDYRYRLIDLLSFPKHRIYLSKNKRRYELIPGRYHGYEYARIILNDENHECETNKFKVNINPLPNEIQSTFDNFKDKPIVAIAPGGAKNTLSDDDIRRWPIDNYVKLAKMCIENDFILIVTGSLSDNWVSDEFCNLPIINLVGKTTIIDILSLYNSCNVLVSHDSGPLHIAEYVGTPIVGIFGPTNPFEKISKANRNIVLWGGENLYCRPCYDGKSYAVCEDRVCLNSIAVEDVFKAIKKILVDVREGN